MTAINSPKLIRNAKIALANIVGAAKASEAKKTKADAAIAAIEAQLAELEAKKREVKAQAAAKVRQFADLDESASLKTLAACAIVLVEAMHRSGNPRLIQFVDDLLSKVDRDEARTLAALLPGGLTIVSMHAIIEARGAAFGPARLGSDAAGSGGGDVEAAQ